MNYLKNMFILFVIGFMSTNVISETLDKFVKSLPEQHVSAEWVQDNAQVKLSDKQALSIVKQAYSQAYSKNLNPHMLLAMMKVESGFNTQAKSRHGSVGILQVIPYWHRDKIRGRNPLNLDVSVEVGSKVLKDCFDKHKNNSRKSLTCYNGGGDKDYYTKIAKSQSSIKVFILGFNNQNKILLASK